MENDYIQVILMSIRMSVNQFFTTTIRKSVNPRSFCMTIPKIWITKIKEVKGIPYGIKIIHEDNQLLCQLVFNKHKNCMKLKTVGQFGVSTQFHITPMVREFIYGLPTNARNPKTKEYKATLDLSNMNIIYQQPLIYNSVAYDTTKKKIKKYDANIDVKYLITLFDECLKTPQELLDINFEEANRIIKKLANVDVMLFPIR